MHIHLIHVNDGMIVDFVTERSEIVWHLLPMATEK